MLQAETHEESHSETGSEENKIEEKPQKLNRFHKAEKKAAAAAEERRLQQEQRAKNLTDKQNAIQKRKQMHRQVMQRTKSGQPVMKNRIHHLLQKIQNS